MYVYEMLNEIWWQIHANPRIQQNPLSDLANEYGRYSNLARNWISR